MQFTVIGNCSSADANALAFTNFFLATGEGRITIKMARAALLYVIPIESDLHCFCAAIFNGIETSCISDTWPTMRAIPTTKNAKLDETNKKAAAYIQVDVKTLTSADK